tara:strand:- start:15 stop:1061 length:1047 start_codon:yes stop_codon:yes gene_type:complete
MFNYKNLVFAIYLILSSHFTYANTSINHGPIGVMGDHFHEKGELMISLRVSNMEMKKNIFNGTTISDKEILNQPNPFSQLQKKLSVIPKKMTMKMIMLGAMYAPSDKITLMTMAMFEDKEMTLGTHSMMMNRKFLGSFETSSSDISKISLSALYKLKENNKSRWHLTLGLEKSVAQDTKKGKVLTPMNMESSMILPYGMQNGDKSWRIIAGLTNVIKLNNYIIGNQFISNSVIDGKEWYFGNKWQYNLWFQGLFNDKASYSIRLNYNEEDNINGRNASIMAPVQTANPVNYGGEILNLGLGFNFITNIFGGNKFDRFGIEFIQPLDQEKNGLQMKDKFKIMIGFQKSL